MFLAFLLELPPASDEQLGGDDGAYTAAKEGGDVDKRDTHPHPRTPGDDFMVAQGHAKRVVAGSGLKTSAVAISPLGPTAATAAAAAADDALDTCYDDDDEIDDDDEGEAQTHDTLLPRSTGPRSGRGEGVTDTEDGSGRVRLQEANERPKEGVLTVVRIMLATDQSASFFMAVGLSGMGAGVIDTFLFIR